MRILHILDELKPSGAESMLKAAAPYWQDQGLDCDILSVGHALGSYASSLARSGYQIYHIPFSSSPKFVRKVFQLLKVQHYDAIHIHPERGSFWYALIAYLTGHHHIVRTVHNVFPFKNALRIERYFQRWIMRSILGVEMVSISRSVQEVERKHFSNRSILIPNWFDSDKLKPQTEQERITARKQLGVKNDTVIFISIGGCWSYKNHSSIIQALRQLPKNSPVLYLHVGQERDGYPERKLVESSGVADRCLFLGTVPDILSALHAADVYVMPSLFEGFGVAAIEAMGAGLPAILSDVPGLCDFRAKCDGIYWVKPTPDSIATAMMHFIDMPCSERIELGRNLSRSVHKHFAIDIGSGAYARLYRECRQKPNHNRKRKQSPDISDGTEKQNCHTQLPEMQCAVSRRSGIDRGEKFER